MPPSPAPPLPRFVEEDDDTLQGLLLSGAPPPPAAEVEEGEDEDDSGSDSSSCAGGAARGATSSSSRRASAPVSVPPGFEGQEPTIPCKDCDRVFYSVKQLRKHAVTHAPRAYACPEPGCTKAFRERAKLKRHMLIHTGERTFVCQECNKSFAYKHNLITHEKMHQGVKPFVCDRPNCDRRFTQASNLHAHIKTHEKFESGESSRAPSKRSYRPRKSGAAAAAAGAAAAAANEVMAPPPPPPRAAASSLSGLSSSSPPKAPAPAVAGGAAATPNDHPRRRRGANGREDTAGALLFSGGLGTMGPPPSTIGGGGNGGASLGLAPWTTGGVGATPLFANLLSSPFLPGELAFPSPLPGEKLSPIVPHTGNSHMLHGPFLDTPMFALDSIGGLLNSGSGRTTRKRGRLAAPVLSTTTAPLDALNTSQPLLSPAFSSAEMSSLMMSATVERPRKQRSPGHQVSPQRHQGSLTLMKLAGAPSNAPTAVPATAGASAVAAVSVFEGGGRKLF